MGTRDFYGNALFSRRGQRSGIGFKKEFQMADIFRNARPDGDDDDYKLAARTLRLTAPYMTREQLTRIVELGQELLEDRTGRQGIFASVRRLNG